MRVLVACECSGRVRDAFLRRGHDAWSCDLKLSEVPGPHFQADAGEVLRGGGPWDLVIAHPPCRYLSYAGNHCWSSPGRVEERVLAIQFATQFWACAPRWAVENPMGVLCRVWREPDQVLNPYQWGEPSRKRTCLWLGGLPPLLDGVWAVGAGVCTWVERCGGKGEGRRAARAVTSMAIAEAMAEQWGCL